MCWPVTLYYPSLSRHGVGPQTANLIRELEAQRYGRQSFPDPYSTRYGVRSKNFFHSSSRYGKINDLRVPRDRNNEFQTALFQPYQRSIGIDDLVVSLYSKGISTRKMAEILEELFHNKYSKSTISRITVNADQDLCKIAGLKLIHFIYSFHSLFTPSSLFVMNSSSCP